MNIAYAGNGPPVPGFVPLIPFLVIGLFMGILSFLIAKRKGRNQLLWFLAGFVPVWNGLGVIWLASLPEKSILDEFESLKEKINSLTSNSCSKQNEHG